MSPQNQEVSQIEFIIHDSGTTLHRIIRIAFLFDVGGHHQYRFTQIQGFTHRFETGRTGVCLATCHLAQELYIIQLIEAQSIVHLFDRRFLPAVPEET